MDMYTHVQFLTSLEKKEEEKSKAIPVAGRGGL
jgi:hypothetical protein